MWRYTLSLGWCFVFILAAPAQEEKRIPPQKADGGFRVQNFQAGKEIPIAKPHIRQEPGQPPVIVYPPSRSSTSFLTTPDGLGVAIDEGVKWEGKIAYLALTWHVVVVDQATGKAVWSASESAFWDTITFANRAAAGQPPRWMLVLRSSRQPKFEQDYDLASGKKGELHGAPVTPAGQPVAIRQAWSGSGGVHKDKLYTLVAREEEWTKVRTELFGAEAVKVPGAGDVDFAKEMLLVCYAGDARNWSGISVELAVEDETRMLLRLKRGFYQTLGGSKAERPFGLFVLPRRDGKPVVLEYNVQNLIGAPANWKEFTRVELKK